MIRNRSSTDTGFPQTGEAFGSVQHQYCGQLGKRTNCLQNFRQNFGWLRKLRRLESATFNRMSSPNWQIAQNFLQFC
jgi:hypothetical protein